MAARATWKGHLRLSLVSCAVGLHGAIASASTLKCHTINRETGNRIREEVVDSVTGEPVPKEDRVKGCEAQKDDYVAIEDDELKAISLESTHTINIESFVDRAEVDERYLDRPYYLAPEDRVSREAFAVIRDAMRSAKVAGLGRVVIFKRERVVLIEPYRDGMLATLLRYEDEVKSPAAVFEGLGKFDAPDDMSRLAKELIERNRAEFDPSRFRDRYEEALVALVRSKAGKAKGGKRGRGAAAKDEPVPTSNVVSLMDTLRKSLAAEKGGAGKSATPATKTVAKRAAKPATRGSAKAATRRGARSPRRAA
jgi:DNA end-binding protein Ku